MLQNQVEMMKIVAEIKLLLSTVATPATTVPRSTGVNNCDGMGGAPVGTVGVFNFKKN